jgi:hypothetical protein
MKHTAKPTSDLSLGAILGDFGPAKSRDRAAQRNRLCVTLWLTPEDKARYDRLQELSDKAFAQKARETLLALISLAEEKAQAS